MKLTGDLIEAYHRNYVHVEDFMAWSDLQSSLMISKVNVRVGIIHLIENFMEKIWKKKLEY